MTKKKGKIIAGFPGIGKTYLEKNYKNVIELESSYFYRINPLIEESGGVEQAKGNPNRVKKESWLEDYIKAIEENRKKCDYLCIVMFEEILDELIKKGLNFTLVFPKLDLKKEYIERYIKRGNQASWVNSMESIFEEIIMNVIYNYAYYAKCHFLNSGEYLSDILNLEKK